MNRQAHHPRLAVRRAAGATALLLALVFLLIGGRPIPVWADPPTAAPQPRGTPDLASRTGAPAAFPDLAIQSLTLNPANPAPGQPATITMVIKNVGTTALWDGFYAHLYVDPAQRPPSPTTPDTNYVGWFLGLNPGATFSWSYSDYTFASAGCEHVIYAWVDRDDAIHEENEQNNLTRLDVCVGSGAPGDAYEPDDTCDKATALRTDGTPQDHTFAPAGDIDWYQFTGIGGAEYVIAARNLGANADAALSLFNRCNLPASFGGSQEIRVTLPTSGTYYIKAVNHNANAANGADYKISITAPFDCSGFYEPNDSRATAGDMVVGAAAQRHRFCKPSDEDWVKFPVQAGASYTVRATASGSQANPTLMGSYDADTGDAVSGNPLQITAPANGTFYVRVTNQPATVHGPTTDYDLIVTSTTCMADAFEPDNGRSEAKTVTINGLPERHTACPAGDRDWAKFTATAAVTYTLETMGLGAASDTILCLYDNIGTQVACDDESGANHGSRITWQATASGTYYAEIRQADAAAAGPATEYEFSIVTGLCRPDLYEPDDRADAAKPLPVDGARQSRNFCAADDHDWVKLQIPLPGWYTLQTGDLAPGSDTLLTLYGVDKTARLADNDDFTLGTASQLVYNFALAGTYYLEVRHFNPTRYGRSTTYFLSAVAGRPTATSTPTPGTPTPTPAATATPPPSGIRTLILTNPAQLTALYGTSRVAPLLDRLTALANHAVVQGEIVPVDGNAAVAAAYAAWQADLTSVAKANQAASAVRGLALDYLAAHPSTQYILLVGDDRIIPARRIKDRTSYPESQYTSLSTDTPVGAAISQDYFLTDDYYADREPSSWQGAELYIPDWAIGRLIETPEEIVSQLDAFMRSAEITIGTATSKALVVGYDFVADVATNIATDLLGQDLGNAQVDSTLIGDSWDRVQFKAKQLNTNPAFKLQSINGHASHASEGAPVGNPITAREVISGTSDLTGALIYSVGCHAGLNVPETSNFPLDLAQAFAQKRANYAANTGFGWGSRIGVNLSERLMQNYTQELLKGTSAAIGQALVAAKQRYYQEGEEFEERDEKVMQQVTLYGFPMYRLNTGAVLSDDDPFPSAIVSSPFSGGAQVAGQAIEPATAAQAGHGAVRIRVGSGQAGPAAGAGYQQINTAWGAYFQLDGHTNTQSSAPLQPRIYAHLNPPAGQRLRGAVFTGGTFTLTAIDPVIDAPLNEYVPITQEPGFRSDGFYPPVPFVLHGNDTIANPQAALSIVLGQYDAGVERLYTDVQYDVYFSSLSDQAGPAITWIDGYYNMQQGQATFKVEATDALTVTRVLIAYTTGVGSWSSFDLTYASGTQKWSGALPGVRGAQYYVQAVDSAGNATAVTRKGGYFRLADVSVLGEVERREVHLPMILH